MLKLPTFAALSMLLTLPISATDDASIQRGQEIYNTVCFACHGKYLEGATGFNLKDSEWIHGGQPEQILASIKQGFPDKGMMAFGAIYQKDQLQDVVNFILSKQEGLRDLKYEIYHGINSKTKMQDISWDSLKADKTGLINPPYINLSIPEVDTFAMRFKGELLIPEQGTYKLSGNLRQKSHFELLVDDKKLDYTLDKRGNFSLDIPLNKGARTFEVRMVKMNRRKDIELNLQNKKFNIPLSLTSLKKMRDQKMVIAAVKEPLIMRKRINGISPGSIAVSFPEYVNFTFDPFSCSVNAVWLGAFLDIAPNINDRGRGGSKVLGSLLFGNPGIELLIDDKKPEVNYVKYSTYKGVVFSYTANQQTVTISPEVQGQTLILTYKTAIRGDISLALPEGANITSENGTITNGILKINQTDNGQFSIAIAK